MSGVPTPAVFFHSDAIESPGSDLVGRRSAGQSFLKGWLAHCGAETLRFYVDGGKQAQACRDALIGLGETRKVEVMGLAGTPDFASCGTVFFPTPAYSRAAWLRQRSDPRAASFVGVTHTVSTRRMIEAFHAMMIEPVEDWDAVICTSRAVQSVVQRQFEAEVDFLTRRFGATRVPQPRLPIIPLGIEAADFAPLPGARAQMRHDREVPGDAIVVMTMGRLSVVEKANPLPLILALDQVAARTGKTIQLWICGWASRPEERVLHEEAAALSSRITTRIIDGRDPQVRRNVWAAADIFTLPADSIQETYGLVPVEAMAAGLPVVMPDWDGFRDTVRHGETGLLVPTRMAPPGCGADLAARFADLRDGYLPHLALVQSQIQIDVPAYAAALGALVADADLRRRMGAAAAAHVRARLDWSAVIPAYLDLARDLSERRAAGTTSTHAAPAPARTPLEIDPFAAYGDYPTRALHPDEPVTLRLRPDDATLATLERLSGRPLYGRDLLTPDRVAKIGAALADGPASCRDIAERSGLGLAAAIHLVLAMAKFDLVRLPPIQPRNQLPLT